MSDIHLRLFRFADDYPAALTLWENAGEGISVGFSDQPGEIEKKLQRDPDLFLVAESDGRLIGTVIGGFDGRRGLVYHLAVSAEYRGQGLGKLLMNEIEQRLRAKGCRRVYLLVKREGDAAGFYEKHGWEEMTRIRLFGKNL